MQKGDTVHTPRFGNVIIEDVFDTKYEARENGYTEPTYYDGNFEVFGKSLDMYHMVFAATKNYSMEEKEYGI